MNNRFILLVRYGMKWLGQSQRGICGTVFSHNIGAFANRCRPDDAQSTKAVQIMSDEFETAMPNANVMVKDVSIPQALEIEQALLEMDGVEDVIWLDIAVDLTMPLETLDRNTVETYYHVNADDPTVGTALYQITVKSVNCHEHGNEHRVGRGLIHDFLHQPHLAACSVARLRHILASRFCCRTPYDG